uniref:Uncharacterized protein n=1 Tax=Rhizophora mucronata TaxID=61149 RepID=A0A2P2QZ36_RHIMU
MHILIYNKIT